MNYIPISEEKKTEYISWLFSMKDVLEGKEETKYNDIFSTDEGDIATAKDLVGNLLALLTNTKIEIK